MSRETRFANALRQLADEIEQGDATLKDAELEHTWPQDEPHNEECKRIDVWVGYG